MPTIISYGAGTNSKAMVIRMLREGEKIDRIVFADTGGERPETYRDMEDFSFWLQMQGAPGIEVVRNTSIANGIPVVTLEEECLAGKKLPGIAYGFGTCSDKWKQRPFKRWFKQNKFDASAVVCIGFDADEPNRAERGARIDSGYIKRYPLIEYGMGRDECLAEIEGAGLPLPGKSACFFCPSSKQAEVLALPPDLQQRAITLERNAQLTTVQGLGRRYAWEDLIDAHRLGVPLKAIQQLRPRPQECALPPAQEVPCGCYDG